MLAARLSGDRLRDRYGARGLIVTSGTATAATFLLVIVAPSAPLALTGMFFVGLSVATKLAPEVFKTQMVALFFLSIALGTAISGRLAEWYTTVNETVYFGVLGAIAIVLGIVLATIAKPVLKLMGGVR